ncbi:IclR family transcriptional regulator [Rhodopila sp.]|uniref:IclR family transcriptional regulator n=1 Tax=Rhodopila sp. TaxID=2480087 RepID=UPI003D13EFD7
MGTAKNGNGASQPKSKASPDLSGAFPETSSKDYNIAAVDRTLDLLEALARLGPASLAALAESAGCTRTAAFRLLRTLQSRGFAIQDEARGLWRLGARWSVLGRAATEQGALAATAMPFLASLGKATGENVYLRVRDGMESETVAIYQTDPAIRMYSEVGKRGPLHAGSSRVLLAFAPEAVQTQLLAQRLNRITPATRIDPTWIAADLQRIRARGYLITSDEVVPGSVSIACPIRDAAGAVVAVLDIDSPSMRMRPPRPRALLPQVMEAAVRLSEALGAVGKPVQDGLIHDETTSSGWHMAGSMINLARPHSIFR